MPSPSQNALIGRAVAGRFTVTRFLGEGGMATVYVAEQAEEPHEVALKIMAEELMLDRNFVKRFQREATAAARVQHPNSVQIIDYGTADGLSYIAMELIRGDDLYVLLERGGALPPRRAARILSEVCDVLSAAHSLGIVHRDLKPENIMVIADPAHPDGERVKVLDFGIAKVLMPELTHPVPSRDSEANSAVTRAGTFIGTPAYMSPEQCGLQTVDTRADIYTCGVLLFQLVTGKLPFEGLTPLHTATMHVHQDAPKPSLHAPTLNAGLEALILKALAKKPADRYQTAKHLGAALRKLLPELTDAPVAVGPPSKRQASIQRSGVASPPSPRKALASTPLFERKGMDFGSTLVADGASSTPARVLLHSEPPSSSDLEDAPISSAPGSEPPTRVREGEPSMQSPPSLTGLTLETLEDEPSRSVGGTKRYGPQKTEVIEAAPSGAEALVAMKATMKSVARPPPRPAAPVRPAAGAPARADVSPLPRAITISEAPESAAFVAAPVDISQASPGSPDGAAITIPASAGLRSTPAIVAPPRPGMVTIPMPAGFVAPTPFPLHARGTPQMAARAGSPSSMTRGILIGFLAAVALMGLVMIGIVLAIGR